MIVYKDLQQGSEEWLKFRCGKASASAAKKVLKANGDPSKSAVKYMRKLARQCIGALSAFSDPHEFHGNKHTDWGNEHEPEAREVFMEETGLKVEEYGFLTRQDGIIGASPDGLSLSGWGTEAGGGAMIYEPVASDFGLEIKCPSVDTYGNTIVEGVLPDDHKLQVHWSMAVSGIKKWYFMSYFPGLNPFIIPVEADEFTERVAAAQDLFLIDYAVERERFYDAVLPSRRKAKVKGSDKSFLDLV